MELSEKQIRRLQKLAKYADDKDLATIENLMELDEKIDDVKDVVETKFSGLQEELKKKLESELVLEIDREELQGVAGKDGKDGKDGVDGKDGKNYILTNLDKKKIASEIKVPVVEKVIEKTEVIRETPIVKEVALKDDGKEIINKINEDETSFIKKEKIEGLDDTFKTNTEDLLNRAVSIVDNRTSFLINKVSNLSEKVDNISNDDTLQDVTDRGATTTNTITQTPSFDLFYDSNENLERIEYSNGVEKRFFYNLSGDLDYFEIEYPDSTIITKTLNYSGEDLTGITVTQ